MSRHTPRLVLAGAAAGLLALSACGGGGGSTGNTVPADAQVVIKATEGVAWNQTSFTVTPVDGKVTIYAENDSSIAHNMYVLDAADKVIGEHVDLPKRGANGTRVLALTPGTYHLVCKIPGHNNMKATLTVE